MSKSGFQAKPDIYAKIRPTTASGSRILCIGNEFTSCNQLQQGCIACPGKKTFRVRRRKADSKSGKPNINAGEFVPRGREQRQLI